MTSITYISDFQTTKQFITSTHVLNTSSRNELITVIQPTYMPSTYTRGHQHKTKVLQNRKWLHWRNGKG